MASSFLKQLANPLKHIVLCTYPESVRFLPHHSGGTSVSRVCYGFLYFGTVSFTDYYCIYFLFARPFS